MLNYNNGLKCFGSDYIIILHRLSVSKSLHICENKKDSDHAAPKTSKKREKGKSGSSMIKDH